MVASVKALEKREKVLKALRELKSTHSLIEISEKIGVNFHSVKQIYARYCENIPLEEMTRKKFHLSVDRWDRHSDEVCEKVINLRNKGKTFSQIGRELKIPSNSVATIYYRSVKIVPKIIEDVEEKQTKWIDEKLVSKYAKKGEYDWLPMFFIKNYNVTHSTAKQIYLQLQALKRKQNHETTNHN